MAMHFHKPNSFYFFDEIDAALDYKNVGVVAQYIKSHTKNTQFCIISLRNNMFEEAAKLVPLEMLYHRSASTNSMTAHKYFPWTLLH